jgi:hypothetical protein
VVDFSGPYHIILKRPCYVKFMAIAIYAYLKLKILRPAGIITVEAKTQRALDCEQNDIELATATVKAAKLRELCPRIPPTSIGPAMPCSSGTFKAVEDAKAVQIDIEDPATTVQIRVGLNPK